MLLLNTTPSNESYKHFIDFFYANIFFNVYQTWKNVNTYSL